MKKRFIEDQIHKILKESGSGVSTLIFVGSMESVEIRFTDGV
ncbi:hypothetical protein LEP1GSC137_2185 [Leptospira borgpetersenii str. Noumea 25]|uniref:Uncharacterized protein n=1 Tax=Leptospira borgpetersenii serovar Ballum TaxID=280505 RepID=A0A0S2IMC3_LEPBO|nr:hypothetical protein [Leptospira borgpetersenii]ALO24830.1 hypothetical protein LBBP_00482 [Leptospira borgpetersenii serovar Ballum]EKR02321.1 hypothetical protein LEP1GSC121_0775 [Leptospira borgpetersenii serovar Castellonis str. 200801910]EMO11046.1 hypothetical protein LEP1GSC137_2185 [Leptospira borgpetersenii str. Noumea 25]